MRKIYILIILCLGMTLVWTACKKEKDSEPAVDNFELKDNHFVWDGKTFDLDLFQWAGESFNNSTKLYKFDFQLNNNANRDHELYFEDFHSMNSNYLGDYVYSTTNGNKEGIFSWFGLDINRTGNTTDTAFSSKYLKWVEGEVSIKEDHGYQIIEFKMTYDDARVLTGYYAEKL